MPTVRRVETYLSPKHAIQHLRVSRATLVRLLRRGLLTQYRTEGGHRRYALSELQALKARLTRVSRTN